VLYNAGVVAAKNARQRPPSQPEKKRHDIAALTS
jgi:hypothetical protein